MYAKHIEDAEMRQDYLISSDVRTDVQMFGQSDVFMDIQCLDSVQSIWFAFLTLRWLIMSQ